MEKYPKIFVVVLNYNGKRTLMECLRSVFDCDYSNFEVVLVDIQKFTLSKTTRTSALEREIISESALL